MKTNPILAGVAGAVTTTVAHEVVKKLVPASSRLDKLGEQGIQKIAKKTGLPKPSKKQAYWPGLVGDIALNSLYYSFAGRTGGNRQVKGIILGLVAGISALYLPGKLGLDESYTRGTARKAILTVAFYTLGGIVAGAIASSMEKKRSFDKLM